jgi:hypothetical protein
MTQTQLLILANVILVALVPLEWLYYGWQDRKCKRQASNISAAQLSDDSSGDLAEDGTSNPVNDPYQCPSETAGTT